MSPNEPIVSNGDFRRLAVFALRFPIFVLCLLTWGWIGVAIYCAAVMTAYAILGLAAAATGLSPVERSALAWASVLSPDKRAIGRGESQTPLSRAAFSVLETDAVPVQCLNVRQRALRRFLWFGLERPHVPPDKPVRGN